MTDRKLQFQRDWLERNWDRFVAEGVHDARGRLITVSDALELTKLEGEHINEAFRIGACATHDAIEIIAKQFLIQTVISELWANHLADEQDKARQYKDEISELAFENHDMARSAK